MNSLLWSLMRRDLPSCQELVVVAYLEHFLPEYPGLCIPCSVHGFLAPREPVTTVRELNAFLAKIAASYGDVQVVDCAEDDERIILGCLYGSETIGTKTIVTKFVLDNEKGERSRHEECGGPNVVTRSLWATVFPNVELASCASQSASGIDRRVVRKDDPLFRNTAAKWRLDS